jgi:FlaA1/EpsC-like NDP-sugar epimerase
MPATQKHGVNHTVKRRLLAYLLTLPRDGKRTLMVLADVLVLTFAIWGSLALKQETLLPEWPRPLWAVALVIGVATGVFAQFGLYRAVIRFISPRAVAAIAAGATAAVIAFSLLNLLAGQRGMPYTSLIIFWAFALLFVGGVRYVARSLFLRDPDSRRDGHRVLIYGAGSAGVQLASALRSGGKFIPLAFIDDNESLHRTHVDGIEVVGPDQAKDLVQSYGISRVLLALPSASRTRRKQILSTLEPLGVRVQTVPDVMSIINGCKEILVFLFLLVGT